MAIDSDVIVRVGRQFDAPPERVYDAWLDPALIGQWMFGPRLREEEVLSVTVDPKVGGHFSFKLRRGGQELDHVGEYLTLNRPRQLVFTWGMRENLPETSQVKVDIAPLQNGSELILAHQLHPDWADFAPSVEKSWTMMLDVLAEVVAEPA